MVKFLLTENLNKLARYLRMLGYDASVYKSISFPNKIRIANKDRRIYLTRSQKEAKSTLKFNRFLIKSENVLEQLKELKQYLKLSKEHLFTRCLECNKLLFPIEKDKISVLIPEYIYRTHNVFLICRKCGKIFWKGTHYQSMMSKIEMLFPKQ